MYCEVVIIDCYCGTGDGRGDQRVLGQKERKKEEKKQLIQCFLCVMYSGVYKKIQRSVYAGRNEGAREEAGEKKKIATVPPL